jgi:hypothetical protein
MPAIREAVARREVRPTRLQAGLLLGNLRLLDGKLARQPRAQFRVARAQQRNALLRVGLGHRRRKRTLLLLDRRRLVAIDLSAHPAANEGLGKPARALQRMLHGRTIHALLEHGVCHLPATIERVGPLDARQAVRQVGIVDGHLPIPKRPPGRMAP